MSNMRALGQFVYGAIFVVISVVAAILGWLMVGWRQALCALVLGLLCFVWIGRFRESNGFWRRLWQPLVAVWLGNLVLGFLMPRIGGWVALSVAAVAGILLAVAQLFSKKPRA